MAPQLTVSWLEVILIGIFGVLCVGSLDFLEERTRSALSGSKPSEDAVQLEYKIPAAKSRLLAIEQELAALRSQVIVSRIEVQRHRAETGALENRYPVLRSGPPGLGALDAGALDAGTPDAGTPDAGTPVPITAGVMKAFDDVLAAEASSMAFANSLTNEIERLEEAERVKSVALLQAQQGAASKLTTTRRAHEEKWIGEFRAIAAPVLAALAIAAGFFAMVLTPNGRRRSAGFTVFIGVLAIASTVFGYHIFQSLGAAAGAVVGLLAVSVAVRVAK